MVQAENDFPLITVIIATYNSAKTLRWALQSVREQEFQNFEVRVIGDACTDESEAVVASFADPRFYWKNLPQNIGTQGGPNNQGLADAKGKYIAYLGHDDLWFPWHLSRLITCLEEHQADFVFSLCALLSPTGVQNPLGPPMADVKTYADHFTPPSSWLHRRDLIDSCGLWRTDVEALPFQIDVEFWKRAFKHKKMFQFCPHLTVLKFPSPWWNSYKRTQNHPQEAHLHQLFKVPQELHAQILTDIAIHLNRQLRQRPRWMLWLKLIRLYGKERWPLSHYYRWRFQKDRRKAHLQRGLSLSSKSPNNGSST